MQRTRLIVTRTYVRITWCRHARPHPLSGEGLCAQSEKSSGAPRGPAGTPVSRILSWTTIHLCDRPGPRRAAYERSCLVLHRVGFAEPPCRHDAGALLPHRFTLTCTGLTWGPAIGGLLSVALSCGSPRVGLRRPPCPSVSGLSSTGFLPAAAVQRAGGGYRHARLVTKSLPSGEPALLSASVYD